jgi:hypothetical protein
VVPLVCVAAILSNLLHDKLLVLPHLLELLGWVIRIFLQHDLNELVNIKTACARSSRSTPCLCNLDLQSTEQREIIDIEIWRLRRLRAPM